ncbi:hypothetical protein J7K42_01940 [bacterium]|nr:hypothetical protein [bacterium]
MMNCTNHQTLTPNLSFLAKIGNLIEVWKANFRQLTLIMVLFLILPLLSFYLFQVGLVIKENYLVKNYSRDLEKLTSENEMLVTEAIKTLSLENIEKEVQKLNFVPISEIKYISISYDLLARENH